MSDRIIGPRTQSNALEPAPSFGDFFRNAFVVYVLRTQRMINQLDLAARLARTVPVTRLRVHPGTSARELAAMVEDHARELVAAGHRG